MSGLRAYALDLGELRAVAGAPGTQRERFRALVRRALEPETPPDRLGPIYRRVPGARVVAPDDPTPADLATLLDGGPVPHTRAAATWRLVEAVAAGLATNTATLADTELPTGLLAPLGLPVPPVDGFVAGWCTPAAAAAMPGLAAWSRNVAPGLSVVVLGRPGA